MSNCFGNTNSPPIGCGSRCAQFLSMPRGRFFEDGSDRGGWFTCKLPVDGGEVIISLSALMGTRLLIAAAKLSRGGLLGLRFFAARARRSWSTSSTTLEPVDLNEIILEVVGVGFGMRTFLLSRLLRDPWSCKPK